MGVSILQTDPLKALVSAYDVWHEIDACDGVGDGLAERDRVILSMSWTLLIKHDSDEYVLSQTDGGPRSCPIMCKKDVVGSVVQKLAGTPNLVFERHDKKGGKVNKCVMKGCDVAGRVTFGFMSGDAVRRFVDPESGEAERAGWKSVYEYLLRDVDEAWKDDLLSFFDNGIGEDMAALVGPHDYVGIAFSSPMYRDLVDIPSFMAAFDAFMGEVRDARVESGEAYVGIDPISGERDSLVKTMIYLPSLLNVHGARVLGKNGPLTSNAFAEESANFFGSGKLTKSFYVSDTTDFKCAAMLDYACRKRHYLRIGEETLIWFLSGEYVEESVARGVTVIDIDNIGEHMFRLSRGLSVPENATFGKMLIDDGTAIDVNLHILRVGANGARPVYKGVTSYTWDGLVRNHRRWQQDTCLWTDVREGAPDALAMRAGIDGYRGDDGKFIFGLADALCRKVGERDHAYADLRCELVRMCVEGLPPSQRLVSALCLAMQSHACSGGSRVIGLMQARLAKCFSVRSGHDVRSDDWSGSMPGLSSQAMCIGAVLAIGERAQAAYDSSGRSNMYARFGKMLLVSPESAFPRLVEKTMGYISLLQAGRGKSTWSVSHDGGRGTGFYLSRKLSDILSSDMMVGHAIPMRLSALQQTEVFLGRAVMEHELYSSASAGDDGDDVAGDVCDSDEEEQQ